jgi:hypothetical protein
MDLLQETEMIDAFLEFFLTHPATHSQGSLQIDLILISLTLLKFVDNAFILDPTNSQSNHSCIGIDFKQPCKTTEAKLSLSLSLSQKSTCLTTKAET